MKNYILILVLSFSFVTPSFSQMNLANTYGYNQNYESEVVNLSLSGKKIAVVRNQGLGVINADTIFYYNLDYSLWKIIPCQVITGFKGVFSFDRISFGSPHIPISYSSETLFNSDSLLEAAIFFIDSSNLAYGKILIINENGLIVDSILNVLTESIFKAHSISTSIFVATASTKTGNKIYNLPGTIPCDICTGGLGLAVANDKPTNLLSSPIPNPSKDVVTIRFSLPESASKGELTIYNTNGQKMKSYTVDNRFGFIVVDNSLFDPGLYYYNLTVDGGQVSTTQRMLVIK
jgi:Secretion system C-terminal sorting domain